jgi:thioredoxin-like negative regulator of GroEL
VVSLGVFGVTAGAISGYDTKNKELHDLAVIGGGKPVVVQIHDTSCSICRNLKSRTLNVLEDQSSIEYRIADIQTSKGRSLQDKYGVEKTTLLLFDAEGGLVDTVYGLQTIEQLKSLFARSFPPQA